MGPNNEQIKAIEHSGGVLLKAGAGSGKTFVLIHHIVYQVEKIITEYSKDPLGKTVFEQKLKSSFRQTVLMTFTKKAAGEISIRLTEKLRDLSCSYDESGELGFNPWEVAKQSLDYLNVGTIHGFCFKLIKQGFFPEISTSADVITEVQYKKKMKDLFDSWIEQNLSETSKNEHIRLILRDRENILVSLENIFADPSLRTLWRDGDTTTFNQDSAMTYLLDYIELSNLNETFVNPFYAKDYLELKKYKWFEFLKNWNDLNVQKLSNLEDFKKLTNFFEKLKRFPTKPSEKQNVPEIREYFEKIKKLRDFFKKEGNDITLFFEFFEDKVNKQYALFDNLVKYIETNYSVSDGITFSDLEYLVNNGLNSNEILENIHKSYSYFIVDEFQDTSMIQFNILKKLIDNDFNRIFCVGDIKQAIYGFRGGELGVFLDCESKIVQNLSLKNNYRSLTNIISFNNLIFKNLFSKGLGFEDKDIKPVEVEFQNSPLDDNPENMGKLSRIIIDLTDLKTEDDSKKLSVEDINYFESLAIVSKIKKLVADGSGTIAVLYKKLAPSETLIELLIKQKISFTAQMKIPFNQDPIIGIFYLIIENLFNKNTDNKEIYLNKMIEEYCHILNINIDSSTLNSSVESFYSKIKYTSLYESYCSFLFDLGIRNSNYKKNLAQIRQTIELNLEDIEKIYETLIKFNEEKYSIDFQFGGNPDSVKIMSTHSSKGLEFEHVFLGGMSTNGSANNKSPMVGKIPGSFKWSPETSSKDLLKTPQYLYELLIAKHTDFSESKRLFYVACTRAEKELIWVDFNFSEKSFKSPENSWIKGIHSWKDDGNLESRGILKLIEENEESICINELKKTNVTEQSINKDRPLFHKDSLGIVGGECENKNPIIFINELSITRLATIAECPRKFYLKNICSLDIEETFLKDTTNFEVKVDGPNEDEFSALNLLKSSAKRGTSIHESISLAINHNFVISMDIKNEKDLKSIEWCLNELKKFSGDYKYFSEKELKFEVFSHMVTGIPDLYMLPTDSTSIPKLWDFKTGQRKKQEDSYWFQLNAYAYALYELDIVSKEKEIEILLCYVDENIIIDKTVSFELVNQYILSYWKLINSPEQQNRDHCEKCSYGNICH